MKLLVGPGLLDPVGNEAFLVKALKRIADVKTFDQTITEFEKVLAGLPVGWNPDAVVIRDAEFYKMPSGLETADCPVFGLIGDYNLSLTQMLPVLGCFDYFLCDTKGVRIFNKLGFDNCRFFCLYGWDPELHRDYGFKKEWDVVFVGNLNHAVQQEREVYLYQLAKLAEQYRVYINTGIYGTGYARLLNRAELVFNFAIRDEANMRFFEAMACGAVVMNNHLTELDILGFKPDEHYLKWEDPREDVVRYFKTWPGEKREIVRGNNRRILRHHTYEMRAHQLLKIIKSADIDISKRRLAQLSRKDASMRWARYFSEEVEVRNKERLNRFHPIVVRWQKHLIQNELEICNFDFDMWFWWIELLSSSGLDDYLARFLVEREVLLDSIGCYRDMAKRIRDRLNTMIYGFHVNIP